jgi:hypothetical protein
MDGLKYVNARQKSLFLENLGNFSMRRCTKKQVPFKHEGRLKGLKFKL